MDSVPQSAPRLPEPVFADARHHIKIYQGDCLDVLAAIPEEKIDLIFADPPYFLSNDGITCHAGRMVSVNKGAWDKSRGPEENHKFILNWLSACQRVLRPNGSIWVSGTSHVVHCVGFAMQQLGFKLLNDISWVKPNPPPNLSCRYFTHATETIIWAAKNKKSRHTFNYKLMRQHAGGKQMKSVWQIAPPDKSEKRFGKHPTQKPLALLERILLAASDPRALVLDPFMGSGTTAIAALRLRRSFIGIEADAAYIHLALCRIGTALVAVAVHAEFFQIDLDPLAASMDRSKWRSLQAARSDWKRVGAGLQSAQSGLGEAPARSCRGASSDAPEAVASGFSRTSSALRRGGPACPPSVALSGISLQAGAPTRLVHHERKFFFVGSDSRSVIFSTVADSLDDAWLRFRQSRFSHVAVFSVISTETQIYLA